MDQAIFLDVPSLRSTVVIPTVWEWPSNTTATANVRILPWISGGDGSAESDSGSGDGDGTPPGDGGGTSGGTDGGTSGGDDEKKFTQKDVNDLIARETAKAQRGKLDPKELGFESGKELKEFLDQQKAALDAAKDQATKDLEAAKEQAKKEAEAGVLSKANERLLRAEFVVAASGAGVTAPLDAFVLAKTMDIWAQVEIVEQGDNFEVKGFDKDFFDTLKKEKPYLFGTASGSSDVGAGAGNGGTPNRLSPQELAKTYPALGNRQ